MFKMRSVWKQLRDEELKWRYPAAPTLLRISIDTGGDLFKNLYHSLVMYLREQPKLYPIHLAEQTHIVHLALLYS